MERAMRAGAAVIEAGKRAGKKTFVRHKSRTSVGIQPDASAPTPTSASATADCDKEGSDTEDGHGVGDGDGDGDGIEMTLRRKEHKGKGKDKGRGKGKSKDSDDAAAISDDDDDGDGEFDGQDGDATGTDAGCCLTFSFVVITFMEEVGRSFHTIVYTFARMTPIFLAMVFCLVAVLFYLYALLGMELFGNDEFRDNRGMFPSNNDDTRCSGQGLMNEVPAARFCDFNASMFSLFQVFSTSNWHMMLYATIDLNPYASYYFVSFYILSVVLLLNLVTAVVLDVYRIEAASFRQQGEAGVELSDIIKARDGGNDGSVPLAVYVERNENGDEYDDDASAAAAEARANENKNILIGVVNSLHGWKRRYVVHAFRVV
jgi:hypothetical protein